VTMDRVSAANFLTVSGRRMWQDKNPGAGIPAGTEFIAAFMNSIQETILAAIEGTNQTPTDANVAQLLQAIILLSGAGLTSVSANVALTASNAGVVLVNAAAGSLTVTLPAANSLTGSVQGSPQLNRLPLTIIRTDTSANTVTIACAGANTLAGGATSMALGVGAWVGLASDGVSVFYMVAGSAGVLGATGSVAGIASNLIISTVGISNFTSVITADAVVLKNSAGAACTVNNVTVSAVITTGGAGGLSTGALAASTWYYVWLIFNGSTISAIFDPSGTAPTLPAGYTYAARVGRVRSDSSGSKYLLQTLQRGRTVRYVVLTGSNTASLPQMASGGTSGGAWSSISTTAFVPPNASKIAVMLWLNGTGSSTAIYATVAPNASYSAGADSSAPLSIGCTSLNTAGDVMGDILLEASTIQYAANFGSSGLCCLGWEENF